MQPKKILLSGCNGQMGRRIVEAATAREDCKIAAGIDISAQQLADFHVFSSPAQCSEPADVIIDFSHPSALSALLEYALEQKIPTVISTTGLSSEQIAMIEAASKQIPLFFTANMSLGVNLLAELAKKAASVLGGQFDIEIIEKHHNQKIDAPSGTALMLANEISSVLPTSPHYMFDRHAARKKRDPKEIGIHAIRGGTIVGEHEVLFAGRDETISLTHIATSKEVFATGSLNAAIFLCGKPAGLYNMGDLLGQME